MHADFIRPSTSPILRNLRFALLLPLSALIACGSSGSQSSSSSTTPTPTPYNFNGIWQMYSTTGVASYLALSSFSGPLQVSNGAVTGTLTPYAVGSNSYVCTTVVNLPISVTGTLDAENNLTLTFPLGGGTATIVAALADNPSNYAYGSWQINGGTCPMSVTTMEIKQTTATTPETITPSPTTGTLSGNWSVNAAVYPTTILAVTGFGGPLQFSGSSVTGTLSPYATFTNSNPANCFYTAYPNYTATGIAVGPAAFTGTLDSSNNLTLTAPLAGGTATITATLSGNPQTFASGSYQIVGGPCATPATAMTLAQYAPISGTYSGTFNDGQGGNVPGSAPNLTITATLTQSTAANSSGEYPITGTLKVAGTCSETTSFTGFVSGSGFFSTTGAAPSFTGNSDPTASSLYYAALLDTTCNYTQGTLTRQ